MRGCIVDRLTILADFWPSRDPDTAAMEALSRLEVVRGASRRSVAATDLLRKIRPIAFFNPAPTLDSRRLARELLAWVDLLVVDASSATEDAMDDCEGCIRVCSRPRTAR